MLQRSLIIIFGLLFTNSVYAHEFWISPVNYEIGIYKPFEAHFRIGQNFNGSSYSFIEINTKRHEVMQAGKIIKVSARNGDRPAFQLPGLPNGLAILVHETSNNVLKYSDFEKFINFVNHKSFQGLPQEHISRGLPKIDFNESYSRHAKSLVAIGDGAGKDVSVGLKIEIIALTNPYTDDLRNGMYVQVFMAGQPRANVQVELFERPINSREGAQIKLYKTDDQGIAIVPVTVGHEYMLDNVALIPLEPKFEGDPVWHSLWANLTFSVPKN
ncbi:MAG: DUF4198 domain-containing protein [Paracoccaceae bacterium]